MYKINRWIDIENSTDDNIWNNLSLNPNPNAMHLLEKYSYLQYFNWNNLSENPGIFEIDYMKTKKNMVDIL